ncbi:integral to membrane protein [Lichtheimia corymbifera JMRC:FSU:9682]|uniref:Glycerophosphocholine acyltransferase 1 n=1 Tax=Lichtheimia corymbifera JMRC:FSU:9682 TaxID=1263082 RepID=A0A068RW27_9FUNG|nr:integral to membrane protein [Lichtheimia corymbifera JMRC:FSU:9682]
MAASMTKPPPELADSHSMSSGSSSNGDDLSDFEHDLDVIEGWTTADFISENDFDMIEMLSAALEQVTHQLNDKQREIRARSTEWTTKTKEKLRRQTARLEDQKTRLQAQLLKKYDAIEVRMNRDAKTVRLRDKISFVVGVGNACVSPALAARLPTWIPLYYTIQSLYLLSLRYLIYKVKKWHYFIFDLCYFVNAMTLLFLWVFPGSRAMFIATYCLTNGPVAWAIVTWRNSLVFHSLDKITSVFIHIFPPLVMYTIRWLPELECQSSNYRDTRFPGVTNDITMSFKEAMLLSTIAYLIWQALYFVFIMVRRREKVESGLRMTSYSWLLDDSHGRKGLIQKAAFVFGAKYKLYMFMLLQLVYNVVTTMPTYFLFQHFWLHTLFLITIFTASIFNGASFYIEVFSRRYALEVEKLVERSKSGKQDMDKSKTA